MRASQKFQDSAYEASLMHPRLGLDLPAMLVSLGMQDVGNQGRTAVVHGGTLGAHFYRLCFEVFDPGHICRGVVTKAEAEARCRALNDPSFAFVEPTVYAVWGRKPSALSDSSIRLRN